MTEVELWLFWARVGGERVGERDDKEAGGNLGGNVYVHYFDCGDGFMGVYLYLKTHQILNLNMCSSLYINYTLVKNILSAPKQNGTKSYI